MRRQLTSGSGPRRASSTARGGPYRLVCCCPTRARECSGGRASRYRLPSRPPGTRRRSISGMRGLSARSASRRCRPMRRTSRPRLPPCASRSSILSTAMAARAPRCCRPCFAGGVRLSRRQALTSSSRRWVWPILSQCRAPTSPSSRSSSPRFWVCCAWGVVPGPVRRRSSSAATSASRECRSRLCARRSWRARGSLRC